MKRILFIFLLLFLLLQCDMNKKVVKETSEYEAEADFCQDFITFFVLQNWKKLKVEEFRIGKNTYKFYVGDKNYWEKAILANQFCFRGKSKEEMEKLLGKPSRISDFRNRTFYFVGKTQEEATWQLQLNYNDLDILISITDTVMFVD
ncbi:MAG: hypothetical protein H6559_03340 [Lewinellaceae bacterium]|nr:hypothetical protein [Lewinellaceae bacterium]